jgi:hypothetical protein
MQAIEIEDLVRSAGEEQDGEQPILAEFDSAAIQRLVNEVASAEPIAVSGYNRTHNRHNR